MKNLTEIYKLFESHLMNDEKPSLFFNHFFKDTSISNTYPFTILSDLKKINQSPKYHPEGNVWNHTMLVVDHAASIKNQSPHPEILMWAALLHDTGKVPATKIKKGRITAYDHDKFGEKLAFDFLTSLDAPGKILKRVPKMVRWHMQVLFVVKNLPFSDIKTMLDEVDLDDIARLSLCDRLGRGAMTDESILTERRNVDTFIKKCQNYIDI